jgi:hypothetical protein
MAAAKKAPPAARTQRGAELRARGSDSFALARYLKGSSVAELAALLGVVAKECARRGVVMPLPLAAYSKLEAGR